MHCSQGDFEQILLLVAKGNLRHRILKLGNETAVQNLTRIQWDLFCITQEQWFGTARPEWAGGAFIYLSPDHALMIQDIVKKYHLKLQSKHLVVSQTFRHIVEKALLEDFGGKGRESFLLRRAGFVEVRVPLPLPTKRPVLFLTIRPGEFDIRRRHATDDYAAYTADLSHARALELLDEAVQQHDFGGDCIRQPAWACGCRVFLNKYHIEDTRKIVATRIQNRSLELIADRHVFVSQEFRIILERALGIREGEDLSAEEFLKQRSQILLVEEPLVDVHNAFNNWHHWSQQPQWRYWSWSAGHLCDMPSASHPTDVGYDGYGDAHIAYDDGQVSFVKYMYAGEDASVSYGHHPRSSIPLDGLEREWPPSKITNRPNEAPEISWDDEPYGTSDGEGIPDRNYLLKSLSNDLKYVRTIDNDLFEYLTSPPSVQEISPDMWEDAWEHVCRENSEWLEMRLASGVGLCPFCKRCKKWAVLPHLLSESCRNQREKKRPFLQPGKLLEAILEASAQVACQ